MRALLLSTIALSTAVAALPGQRNRNRQPDTPVELKNFTFEEKRFHSDAVDRDMEFGIYLPAGYEDAENKDTKYPLIIWLHGMFEDHKRFHHRGGAPVLDTVVGDGTLLPCIFVTANGGRTSMYVNRDGQRWEDLITVDLLAHLKQNYRVSERREQRAIMGVSMGGMAALRIAFTQPELFGAVAAHSSAVFAEDPDKLPPRLKQFASRLGLDEVFGDPIEKEPWQKANPLCIANREDVKELARLHIYFDAGTDDRYGFAEGNELLHAALDKRKVKHTWRLIDGGGHSWGNRFQDETLPYSFAFVGGMFAGKDRAGAADGKGSGGTKKPGGGEKR
jgi:S-formylglutathione hydrolase FrmB